MTTAARHAARIVNDDVRAGTSAPRHVGAPDRRSRTAVIAISGLRLTIGFEFLWAFVDKLFGLGYATPSAKGWIHGGSPTEGLLSGVSAGPLKGLFHSLAGIAGSMDWLIMAGLLRIGTALIVGVALRPAAAVVGLLMMMWFVVWPFARMAEGAPTGSTNPAVDEHVINTFALVVIAVLAGRDASALGRHWSALPLVQARPWSC